MGWLFCLAYIVIPPTTCCWSPARAFMQQNTGSLDSNVVTELTAPGGGVAYSRFGHAIAPLGDLDNDGFEGA